MLVGRSGVSLGISVTAILTFYNNRDYVSGAIRQVLAQTHRDFELLIVDDASTDGTAEALQSQVADIPHARLILNESNMGIARSRNNAVAQAKGDFVWFIDCDDVWEREILAVLVDLVARERADVAVCGAVRVASADSRAGKALDGGINARCHGSAAISALLTGEIRGYLWNKLIRRSLLMKYPFPSQSSQSDLAGMIEIVFSGAEFVFTDRVLYWHVQRPGSITNSRNCGFDNQKACLESVRSHLESANSGDHRDEFAYFEQWFYRSLVVNSSIRLGARGDAASEVHKARSGVTLKTVMVAARFSRREAAIALLMKVGGPLYGPIYQAYLRHGIAGGMSLSGRFWKRWGSV